MKLGKSIGVQENYFSILEYIKWDKFLNVIAKAKESCKNSGQVIDDHFPRMEKLVDIGYQPMFQHLPIVSWIGTIG